MKKNLLGLAIAVFSCSLILAQNTVEKATYYDYWETQKKKVWHELGDGTWHGDAKDYRENGSLWSHSVLEYGVLITKKWFFQSGEVLVQINNNAEGVKNGTQELYTMVRGRRFLKARAEVENGFVKDYKCYHKEGVVKFSYSNDGTNGLFKRFDEEGNLTLEIAVVEGKVSDFETFGLVFKENRIESVGINVVSAEIKDDRYFITTKFDYEPKSYGHYKIPDQHHFLFNAVFNYSDNWNIQFDLDLNLEEEIKENTRFILVLNNADYDEANKWSHSVRGFKYYISELTTDGEFKSYDDNGLCYIIDYENGKEVWKKNYYRDGTLRVYANADSTLEYNEQGQMVKETVGETIKEFDQAGNMTKKTIDEKFWVYNTEGVVIDSDEIRVRYNELNEQYNKIVPTYSQFNNATNEIIQGEFCLDVETGEFNAVCSTKENQYIFEAFKTLHLEYIKTWKAQEVPYDAVMDKYPDGSINWDKTTQLLEKIEIMEATIAYCNVNMELVFEFNKTIEKFQVLLTDPEVKKINKSLKKASSSDEIKTLVSL